MTDEITTTADSSGQARPRKGWGIKEIITTVLFSVLTIVLMLAASSLSLFNLDYAMVGSTAVACFVAGPVFMLMTIRVRRFGTTIFLSFLTACIFMMYGNYWYLFPYYLVMGTLVDLIMLKPSWRANPNRIIIAWCIFSALYLVSSVVPIIIDAEAYFKEAMESRMLEPEYIDVYRKYYTSPIWVISITLITAAGALAGGLLGKRITRKHFAKAGVL